MALFKFTVLKAKFVELLCIKSEAEPDIPHEEAVDTVVAVLKEIEAVSPSKVKFTLCPENMCLVLTTRAVSNYKPCGFFQGEQNHF